jgi:hypothetical protein
MAALPLSSIGIEETSTQREKIATPTVQTTLANASQKSMAALTPSSIGIEELSIQLESSDCHSYCFDCIGICFTKHFVKEKRWSLTERKLVDSLYAVFPRLLEAGSTLIGKCCTLEGERREGICRINLRHAQQKQKGPIRITTLYCIVSLISSWRNLPKTMTLPFRRRM